MIHLKCTSLSNMDYNHYQTKRNANVDWYCKLCLQILFPFNHLDDPDFLSSIFTLKHCDQINGASLRNQGQLDIINKFYTVDKDIDPDRNLLNTASKKVSYYTSCELNDQILNTKNTSDHNLSIIHINARSLNKNINNIELLLNSLNYKFSVIAVTETWLEGDQAQTAPYIPGYYCHLRSRSERRGGGLALYVKDDMKSDIINVPDSIDASSFESYIQLQEYKTCIGIIYRPPDTI